MATNTVPGADVANADTLRAGCWAEAPDQSLILVTHVEDGQVSYEIYDAMVSIAQRPMRYRDTMDEATFRIYFSVPPIGVSKYRWTWHDKTPFPWERVKVSFNVNYSSDYSASYMVATALRLKAEKITKEDMRKLGTKMAQRLKAAVESCPE